MKNKKKEIKLAVGDKYIVTLNVSENLSLWMDEKYLTKVAKRFKNFLENDETVLVFPYPASITKLDK